MTFSEALDVLKQGGRVSREVWHGSTFLCVHPETKVKLAEDHPAHALTPVVVLGSTLLRVDMMGRADLYRLQWVDVTADDWTIVQT